MKQQEVFKKIGGIITELSDQYEYLKTVADDLNDLELELFAANSHFLVDHVEVLCKLNFQRLTEKKNAERATKTVAVDRTQPIEEPEASEKTKPVAKPAPIVPPKAPEPPLAREPRYFEPVVQQMNYGAEQGEKSAEVEPKPVAFELTGPSESAEKVTPKIPEKFSELAEEPAIDKEEPETIRHELILDDTFLFEETEQAEEEAEPAKESKKKKNTPASEEKPVEETLDQGVQQALEPVAEEIAQPAAEEVTKPVTGTAKAEKPAVTEVVVEEVLTINQKISAQAGEKVSRTEQMSIKPIGDLKLAITLNDKLLYVKDLFNGYNLAYSEAIEILNRFSTFEEASRFLKTNYVTKNNWESKPATTEKFYALLKRRYA